MRSILTLRVETRYGVALILVWAVLFGSEILRATANFSNYLVMLDAGSPIVHRAASKEFKKMNAWLVVQRLNEYGDPIGTVYAGGTPLFNEETGARLDRYQYLMQKFPERPWSIGK